MSFDKRIVIDTGTLVSAALRVDSTPGQAYAKALGEFEVCVSAATFAELDRVMRREKFNAYRTLDDRLAFVELYREKSAWHDVKAAVFDCRDPEDNKFLELALAAEAEIIVSSDPDLQILHPYRAIAILKPAEFLHMAP